MAAERGFRGWRSRGRSGDGERVGQCAGLVVRIGDGDVARAHGSRGADGDVGGELSGGVERARIDRYARTKAASRTGLEIAAGDDDARQTLSLCAGIGTNRGHRGRRSTCGYRKPIGQGAALAVGIGDGDVARTYSSCRANPYVRRELSGGVEGAGVHRDTRTQVASGPALEAAASDYYTREALSLSSGTRIDSAQGRPRKRR